MSKQNQVNKSVSVCCFIGHRNIARSEELDYKIREIIEDLIVNHNVDTFLFGSKSEFDSLCHSIVCELKEKYVDIRRIAYTCRGESCVLESERQKWENLYSRLQNAEVCLLGVEEEVEHKTKYTAGKAGYIERNKAMIDDSDYCVFYYDENYLPPTRRYSKKGLSSYQPNSGTKIAFEYANKQNKKVINVVRNTK